MGVYSKWAKQKTHTVRQKNINMYKALLTLFFVVALELPAFSALPITAQPSTAGSEKKMVIEDTSKVALRQLNPEKINRYRSEKAFVYDDATPQNQRLWSKFWSWFWQSITKLLDDETSGTLVGYGIIAFFVGLLLYGIMKLSGMDLRLFSTKSKAVYIPYEELGDNIHEINFNEEIEKATANGNYRLAVRLSYLRSLKLLSDSNQINWLPEKTNEAYINEIKNLDAREFFIKLTREFEYIWYGEFLIDNAHYVELKQEFDTFNRKTV